MKPPRYDAGLAARQNALRRFLYNHHDTALINRASAARSYGLSEAEAETVFSEVGL